MSAAALRRTLRSNFRIASLRPGQEQVIARVLAGADTLAIMPTGAGKSLCYQLPATHLPGKTIVVSPLIALMKDQVDKLAAAGIDAVQLNSAVPTAEERDAIERLERGETPIVFVTAERLTHADTVDALARKPVSLFVVDEAHCISQWGHDFRPAYLELAGAMERLGAPPVLALTATASEDVAQDIVRELRRPGMRVVQAAVYRPNLHYGVVHVTSDDERTRRAIDIARRTRGAGIVYAATIATVQALHDAMREAGIEVARYHGRLGARERREQQDAFMRDAARVMVATSAFGLGVDKRDVRFVVHAQMPGSLDAYYQESGRAGRDGDAASCTLLYDVRDKRIQQFFLVRRYPATRDLDAVQQALARIAAERHATVDAVVAEAAVAANKGRVALKVLVDDGRAARRAGTVGWRGPLADAAALESLAAGYARKSERDRENLERMVFYAQTGLCRWRVLLEHFGEELPGGRCGECDNCRRPLKAEPIVVDAVPTRPARRRRYTPGDAVRVPRYGEGRVREAAGDEVTVEFPDGHVRAFLASYLRRMPGPPGPKSEASAYSPNRATLPA